MKDLYSKNLIGILLAVCTLGLVSCRPPECIDTTYVAQVESAAFYGPANAWFVTRQGDLLRTDDEGRNWETISGKALGGFESITFIDAQKGWSTTRDGQVLGSSDGGRMWVSTAKLGDKGNGPGLGRIRFIDEKHGWIVHPLLLWRTDDGGTNWQRYQSPQDPPASVFYCSFANPREGWLSGSEGAFYRTEDGGMTWHKETVLSGDKDLGETSFLDNRAGWVPASPNEGIYHTEDGGRTWSLLPDSCKLSFLECVQFITKNEGWAAGGHSADGDPSKQKPVVLHTTNGGHSWQRVKVAEDELLVHYIHFTDSSNGWLLSRDNVYHTKDGGESWHIVLRLPPETTE